MQAVVIFFAGLFNFDFFWLNIVHSLNYNSTKKVCLLGDLHSGNNIMSERWQSVEEIAVHLGVTPNTIYKWIERKKMPAHKLGLL